MGIVGLNQYCWENVPEAHRDVDIIEEIKKCRDEKPKILINLPKLLFTVMRFLDICSINKREVDLFFERLIKAGAELIFVYEKFKTNKEKYLDVKNEGFKNSKEIIESTTVSPRELNAFKNKMMLYDVVILCLVQSAEKFGEVHELHSFVKPAKMLISELAIQKNCTWIIDSNSTHSVLPGSYKIWSTNQLNIKELRVQEIDKNIIMEHIGLDQKHSTLFILLAKYLKTSTEIKDKVTECFGRKFKKLTKFVAKLEYPLTDESYLKIAEETTGTSEELFTEFINDLKTSIDAFTKEQLNTDYNEETMKLIMSNHGSYLKESLLNQMPILVVPVFLETNDFNDLVLPWIQKTAGILLKNVPDTAAREIYVMDRTEQKYIKVPLDVIYPDFEVPALNKLLSGKMSIDEKEKLLYWLMGFNLNDFDDAMQGQYLVDRMIMKHLLMNNVITASEVHCFFETFKYCGNKTKWPQIVNNRALQCTFLYYRIYLILHSCFACIGLKYFCRELKFDGFYLQKMMELSA